MRTQIRRQHNAGIMAVFAERVDVHHAMLYEREVSFDGSVHGFGNMMCIEQRKVILDADFQVYINAAAKKAGVQAVEVFNTGNTLHQLF